MSPSNDVLRNWNNSVTEGTSSELDFEADDSLRGVVRAKGAYGLDWLTVEKVQTRNFDQIALKSYNLNRYNLMNVNLVRRFIRLEETSNSIPNLGQKSRRETLLQLRPIGNLPW